MFRFNGEVKMGLRACRMIEEHGLVTKQQVAKEAGVSPTYVERAVKSLIRAGLIISIYGPGGGMTFNRDVITWLDVVEAIEGPIDIAPGIDEELRIGAHGLNCEICASLKGRYFRRDK